MCALSETKLKWMGEVMFGEVMFGEVVENVSGIERGRAREGLVLALSK